MSPVESDEKLDDVVINALAMPILNNYGHEPSETIEEALDRLSGLVRLGSLAIYLGFCRIAYAIEESNDDPSPR